MPLSIGNAAQEGVSQAESKAGDNITNSPILTKRYAEDIIAACESIASVKFSYYEWTVGWSLIPGMKLQKDKCKYPTDQPHRWGENPCR